ncbi:MAG: molybdopterin molybdotransferase MoeA, partial [Vulcanimicrobiaceae bacterium]
PTGGALPAGADAVVPLEDVTDHGDRIAIRELPAAGDCQTPRASDIRAGEAVIGAGRRIGGPELGVLATLGITRVPVYRRPCFAIVSTGDELIDPGETPRQGQVRDSNRYAIAGALRALGVDARHFPRAGDTPASLRAVLTDALAGCDGVVLTGGSSVGLRDLVPRIVAEFGDPGVVVHGIRVKPGKPTMLGAVGGKPIVGLPGNPTSSLMILEAVIRPLIHDCTGERSAVPCVRAIASLAFTGRAGWTWYVPARLRVTDGELSAEPLRLHSAHVSLLARAGGYVVLDERRPEIAAGEPLDVRLFAAGGAPPEGLAP